jgi:hypothetical protein
MLIAKAARNMLLLLLLLLSVWPNNRFATSKDEAAQEMLLCLVERLGHEQEVSWLDSIAQELVGCCDALLDNQGVSGYAAVMREHLVDECTI